MGENLPKGITERGNKFRVSIMVEGRRRTATTGTLEEALRVAEGFRSGDMGEGAQASSPWTYGEALERIVKDHVMVNATTERGVWSKSSNYRRVTDYFGANLRLDLTTGADITEFRRWLKVDQNYSPAYINNLMSSLRMMHVHALKNGGKRTPVPAVEFVPMKQGRIRFIDREEEERMLAWCDHSGQDLLRTFIVLAIDTGLRIEEVCTLAFRDCDMKSGKLHVWQSKSKTPRAVQMTARVRAEITSRPIGEKVLGGVWPVTLRKRWNIMKKAMGLADDRQFTPHVLRHTCCTRLVSAGIDLRTVMAWMGHSNIKTTMRYAQFVPENMFKAASALEQAVAVDKPGTPERFAELSGKIKGLKAGVDFSCSIHKGPAGDCNEENCRCH